MKNVCIHQSDMYMSDRLFSSVLVAHMAYHALAEAEVDYYVPSKRYSNFNEESGII